MPKRVDANQAEIVEALRAAGASVQPIHTIGKGCPDLLVGFDERNYVLEVKTNAGRLTQDEMNWLLSWTGAAYVVQSIDEALAVIGASERIVSAKDV